MEKQNSIKQYKTWIVQSIQVYLYPSWETFHAYSKSIRAIILTVPDPFTWVGKLWYLKNYPDFIMTFHYHHHILLPPLAAYWWCGWIWILQCSYFIFFHYRTCIFIFWIVNLYTMINFLRKRFELYSLTYSSMSKLTMTKSRWSGSTKISEKQISFIPCYFAISESDRMTAISNVMIGLANAARFH